MAAGAKSSRNPDRRALEDSVRGAYVLVDVEPSEQFHSFVFREFPLAKLRIYDIAIDPVVIHRRAQDIMSDEVVDNFLTTFLEGEAIIRQRTQEFSIGPGDLAVIAGGIPYSTQYLKPSRRLVARIPHQLFHDRVLGRNDFRFEASLLKDCGLVPIVVSMFRSLATQAEHLSETEQYTLAESFLELVGAVVRTPLKVQGRPHKSSRDALMRRVSAYLEENYADPKLAPDKIAAANGISTRYLHSLFRDSGTTVSRWIWDRRLKAAREDLLDPSLRHVRVSEIAFRRGFNDSAHFSRAFRERFHIAPSQLRQKAGGKP